MVKKLTGYHLQGKIYDEAQRMIRLVEDIISLSHLDEGAKDMQYEDIDLYELAKEAAQSLEQEAKTACVTLEVSGVHTMLSGIARLYSII